MKYLYLIALLSGSFAFLSAKTYFVAPHGDDANQGTIDSPLATLNKAYAFEDADTIYFRAGTYVITESQIMENAGIYARVFSMSKKTGSESKRTYIGGYKDERPVFDLSKVRPKGQRVCVFYVSGSYHHFKNFEVVGTQVTMTGHTQSECFRNEGGNNNLYENLAMHDGMAIGFYLSGGANNTVLNCDAYRNYDDYSEGPKGGNVDGFGGHPGNVSDTGNVFSGCRAWWNSDDGFDLIRANAVITIDRCWSFFNGYQSGTKASAGDGTGFKSGGYGMSDTPGAPTVIPQHVVRNCLAYDNKNKGFYANHHLGGILWENNTGYRNPSNFCMLNRKSASERIDVDGYDHVLRGNVSFAPRSTGKDIIDVDRSQCTLIRNSFSDEIEVSEADFLSLDESQLTAPRRADGSLPDITFLKPAPASKLYQAEMGYSFIAKGQEVNRMSGLNERQFRTYWKVESESIDYQVTFRGDTVELFAPKGLTLWRKEMMSGKTTIEYDACVVVESDADRLSDLNCFWMASDPEYPDNLWKREKWRNGVFANCYSLQLYYVGYGGNNNSTTRFRRYDGKITSPETRPAILQEYTDTGHLLKANRWYHIKITNENNRVSYYINGERLVDFRDFEPLTKGWFGFRTTQSRTRITNFRYESSPETAVAVPLHWIGDMPGQRTPVSFGVPFDEGDVQPGDALLLTTAGGVTLPVDTWPLAYWPDGSVKWSGIASVIPAKAEKLQLAKSEKKKKTVKSSVASTVSVTETAQCIRVETGVVSATIPRQGSVLIDSLLNNGTMVGAKARLVCGTQSEPVLENTSQVSFTNYVGEVKSAVVERQGDVRTLIKIAGVHRSEGGREWLPFVVRLYFYAGSEQIRMVHSFVYDGEQSKDFIRSLGVRFDVPMREALYNRHVAFSCADGGVWSEPVQPLHGRRLLTLGKTAEADDRSSLQRQQMDGKRIPPYEAFDKAGQSLLDNWAAWSEYRLSQLSADAFTIRKRANDNNPWIGTFSGTRSDGYAFAGDITGGLGLYLHDFWQSYPSSIEITNAKTPTAVLTAWLWSPDAEPMDLRHYDNVAHDLNASYEDVQEGLSTPYGIARTTTLTLVPQGGYAGKAAFAGRAEELVKPNVLMPTPGYLHDRRAFGIWSLPDRSTAFRIRVEDRLEAYIDFYQKAIEQNKWYGFWNYGDVMHSYDAVRHTWRYDIGGFAWDNTELASNMWLWYNFLRTGRADIWRMAEAMGRHTAEVDVYHIGSNAGLGSRHNVSHWGCGAKEARISQAAWNRFYYYLTTDDRCGDLMTEVRDADHKLYELDPMRLAQPRSLYPCTAPARLRIGPDWLAYAGNWMTEWERTGNVFYRDKIITGMKSIVALPSRIFTGPQALGYDPATGVITTECDPTLQSANHLMTIMGGFEVMNEMIPMVRQPEWEDAWLDLATHFRERNNFRISRLVAYAAYHTRNAQMAREAWTELFSRLERDPAPSFRITTVLPPETPAPLDEGKGIGTNDAALWSLDAIYMQEVIPVNPLK